MQQDVLAYRIDRCQLWPLTFYRRQQSADVQSSRCQYYEGPWQTQTDWIDLVSQRGLYASSHSSPPKHKREADHAPISSTKHQCMHVHATETKRWRQRLQSERQVCRTKILQNTNQSPTGCRVMWPPPARLSTTFLHWSVWKTSTHHPAIIILGKTSSNHFVADVFLCRLELDYVV